MTVYLGIAVFVIAILALIYVFLISPRLADPADMELLSCNYAHRGLWTKRIPENSLSAFSLAVRHGVGIELDIQLSKDRRVVVFHDDNLKRMCGVDKKVSELTLRELKELRLSKTDEKIPTLAEVLKLVDGRVPLLIEVKGELPNDVLCRSAANMLDGYRGAFCVESFSPLILMWFKRYRPSYARGQLVTGLLEGNRRGKYIVSFLLTNMLTNFLSRPDFIAINGKKKKNLSFLLCTKAFHVNGYIWTVRDGREYVSCRKAGYFTIFENFLPKEGNKK
ncbi:MAG: glycerophosphodiester phosphodiesterase [Clostridia bacterium]|nr:glycerophosphodiester phosphodiesterase [Clostridia bacterium]